MGYHPCPVTPKCPQCEGFAFIHREPRQAVDTPMHPLPLSGADMMGLGLVVVTKGCRLPRREEGTLT